MSAEKKGGARAAPKASGAKSTPKESDNGLPDEERQQEDLNVEDDDKASPQSSKTKGAPAKKAEPNTPKSVIVLGLGRFGLAAAAALEQLRHEVLGIDADEVLVQRAALTVHHVVEGDASDIETLRQLGGADFDAAIVAIGTHMEASLLAVLALVELGVEEIWAKAINDAHGRILKKIGANHIIYPELRAGQHVAHMITDQSIDTMDMEGNITIMKIRAPSNVLGDTLSHAARKLADVHLLGLMTAGGDFIPVHKAHHKIVEDDRLIIAGRSDSCQALAATE